MVDKKVDRSGVAALVSFFAPVEAEELGLLADEGAHESPEQQPGMLIVAKISVRRFSSN